jgi:metallophosphoesterase (TIGR00282 family)
MKNNEVKILRPANYTSDCPGQGFVTLKINGNKVTIINLLGRVFIQGLVDDPFSTGLEIAKSNSDSVVIVDFHAEATSEKVALGHYLDGSVSAVIGTHTHVQTADEKIMKKGTAYITDAGMCGPADSVIGVKKEIIIEKFLTGLPQSHKVAVGDSIFNACLVEVDAETKKAISIKRVSETLEADN